MARIRSIHPGLFTDPEFATLSDAAQIFYLGLLTEADDQGVFDWNPAKLRIRLRPGKDGGTETLLSELEKANKVASYEMDGRKYGAIRKFTQWQKPKSPKSWHPIPDHFRNYIGSSGMISEIVPQREDGGGKREEESVPNGTGARAPESVERTPKQIIFAEHLRWLEERGVTRPLIGSWLSKAGDDASVLAAIVEMIRADVVSPVSWMAQRFKPKPEYEDWNTRRIREGMKVING